MLCGANSQAQEFTIGVEDTSYYPIYSHDDTQQYVGYARELLDEFAKSKSYKFNYKILPINRLFKALVQDEIDFKYPDDNAWQPDVKKGKNITYSDATVNYIDGTMTLIKNKGHAIKHLGVIMGFTPWPYYDEVTKGTISIHENTSFSGLLQQAFAERVDGIFANIAVVQYNLRQQNKLADLVYDPSLPHINGSYKLSTTKHSEVIDEFNKWMKDNQQLISDIKKKYMVEVSN